MLQYVQRRMPDVTAEDHPTTPTTDDADRPLAFAY